MTDVVGNPEEERRAEFYFQPWAQEAVCRYFYSKVEHTRAPTHLHTHAHIHTLTHTPSYTHTFLYGYVSTSTHTQS